MLYQTENPHGGDIYGGDIRLDFSANTNPLGTPPGVLAAVSGCLQQLHRYPDPYCRELVAAIAAFEGVPPEWILCGSGAAELIYAYCASLGRVTAAELAPTFSEYALALRQGRSTLVRYFLKQEENFQPGRDFLDFSRRQRPQAVFLCSPNNPTGQVIDRGLLEEILAFCQEQGIRLFLDECFGDLSDSQQTMKDHLADSPNLLVLKAFTKSYGMAGLRLGYCLCSDKELLSRMAAWVQPWNVSTPAQAAGKAALAETGFLEQTRMLIAQERPWLCSQLESLGLWVCPSQANYLLFRGPENLGQQLRREGIALRSCANYPGLGPEWYRTAVRCRRENQQLVWAVAQALGRM